MYEMYATSMRPSVTAGSTSVMKLSHEAGMIQSTFSPAPVSGKMSIPVHCVSLRPKNHCMKTPSTNTGMPQMMSAEVVSAVSQNVYWRKGGVDAERDAEHLDEDGRDARAGSCSGAFSLIISETSCCR